VGKDGTVRCCTNVIPQEVRHLALWPFRTRLKPRRIGLAWLPVGGEAAQHGTPLGSGRITPLDDWSKRRSFPAETGRACAFRLRARYPCGTEYWGLWGTTKNRVILRR
jgi:hypothetical protein